MHVFQREQVVVQCGNAEEHVAVRVPRVKAHAARFVLRCTFGKPEWLQREREKRKEICGGAFVVVVRISGLESVDVRENLATAFDADQVAELVRDNVGNPAVAAADLEIPVGEPKVDAVFAGDCAAVAVEGVVQSDAYSARQIDTVTADDRVVDGFGVCRNGGRVFTVFCRIDVLEVFRAGRFPLDVTLVPVKTDSLSPGWNQGDETHCTKEARG